jgi:pentatricopeptide repeat protein
VLRLHGVQDRFLAQLPGHSSGRAETDLLQKALWQSLRNDAARVLVDILAAMSSESDPLRLHWPQWKRVLHAIKNHRVYALTLPLYAALRAQRAPLISAWEEQRRRIQAHYAALGQAVPNAGHTLRPPLQLRMPSRCLALLLDCVIQAAQPLDPELEAQMEMEIELPESAATAAASAHLPPAGLSGVEQAQWILAELHSAPMREYLEREVGFVAAPWNAVLRALTAAVAECEPNSAAATAALQRAQTFFESIPFPDAFTHQLMLGAQAASKGERRDFAAEAETLERHAAGPSFSDGASDELSAMATALRIGAIADRLRSSLSERGLDPSARSSRGAEAKLTPAEQDLLAQAQSLWLSALQSLRCRGLSAMVCGNMMRVLHLAGDVGRQQALIPTAIAKETDAEQEQLPRDRDHNDGAPVFVDAAVYSMLFNSFALSANPRSFGAAAAAAYARMQRRYAVALASRQFARARALQVSDQAVSSYFKFLHRAGLHGDMMREWGALDPSVKQGNAPVCTSLLSSLAAQGDWAAAERVVVEMEQLSIPWDVRTANAWLACYERDGAVEAAQRAWAHLAARTNLPFDAVSYRLMMQVHMARGGADMPGKVDSLHAELRAQCQGGLSLRDFAKLIRAAHAHGLHGETIKWAARASDAGVELQQLPQACQTIVDQATFRVRVQGEVSSATTAAAPSQPSSSGSGGSVLSQSADQQLLQQQHAWTSSLVALSHNDPAATADEIASLVASVDQSGTPWSTQMCNALLGCFLRRGLAAEAAQAWERLVVPATQARPDAHTYCKMMLVCMEDGGDAWLAKIEELYAEMTSGSGPAGTPLQLSARDTQNLIKTAHRCRLAAEARKWADRAKAAGLWNRLDSATHNIVDRISAWERTPRRETTMAATTAAVSTTSPDGLQVEPTD